MKPSRKEWEKYRRRKELKELAEAIGVILLLIGLVVVAFLARVWWESIRAGIWAGALKLGG